MTSEARKSDTEGGFDYSLTALLRQRGMEFDQAKEELVRAKEGVAARTRVLAVQTAQREALEEVQRNESQSGSAIDVSARLRLHDCLRSAQLREAELAAELERARVEQESAFEKARLARLALKANERHQERALARFKTDRQRCALRAADELYLTTGWPSAPGESTSEL
jgi:flagellar biosynthesis chaperone FliJ